MSKQLPFINYISNLKDHTIFFSKQKLAIYLKGLEIQASGWIRGSWWRWSEAATLKGNPSGETTRKWKGNNTIACSAHGRNQSPHPRLCAWSTAVFANCGPREETGALLNTDKVSSSSKQPSHQNPASLPERQGCTCPQWTLRFSMLQCKLYKVITKHNPISDRAEHLLLRSLLCGTGSLCNSSTSEL